MKKRINNREPQNLMEHLVKNRSGLDLMVFLKQLEIPHKTWRRWVLGETTAKFTLHQIKEMAKLLDLSSFDELPDDFCQKFPNPND